MLEWLALPNHSNVAKGESRESLLTMPSKNVTE